MLFDWFTVGARALNFLVLVWLMKRFLYKPVLDAIDEREKRIAQTLADAAAKQAAATKESDEFQQKNADFDRQRSDLLTQAKDAAATERQRLLDEARQQADALRTKKQAALASEMQTLQQDIARRSREEVFAIAQKVLTDLAGTTLEDRMAAVFTQHVRSLDDAAKTNLDKALNTASNSVRVCSAFALSSAQQVDMQSALNDSFARDIPIQFETTPDLISGIELSANGWKLAWNIADFLTSLEQSSAELVKPAPEPPVPEKVAEKAE